MGVHTCERVNVVRTKTAPYRATKAYADFRCVACRAVCSSSLNISCCVIASIVTVPTLSRVILCRTMEDRKKAQELLQVLLKSCYFCCRCQSCRTLFLLQI